MLLFYWELVINSEHPNAESWLTDKFVQFYQQCDDSDVLKPLNNQETKLYLVWGRWEGRKNSGKYTVNGVFSTEKSGCPIFLPVT